MAKKLEKKQVKHLDRLVKGVKTVAGVVVFTASVAASIASKKK